MKRRSFIARASLLGVPLLGAQSSSATEATDPATGDSPFPRTAAEKRAHIAPNNLNFASGDVRRYGAVADGVTDDSAAIQRAVDASLSVFFPSGNYLVRKKVDLRSGSSLIGDGAATLRTDGTSYILSAVGTIGSRRPLRKNVKRADTEVAVATGTADKFRQSGGFFLQSDKSPLGHLTHRSGELGSVSSVGRDAIRVSGAALSDYQISDNAMAAPVSFVENISIRGLKLKNDNYSNNQTKVTSALIYLEFVKNFSVSECTLQENNSAGIAVFNCLNGSIKSNNIGKLRDGRGGILGYGVQVGFSSQGVTISGNTFFECRHAVTTGTGKKSSRTPNYGVSRGLAIVGNSISNCTNSGLDTHEDSDGVTISGNSVVACRPVGIHVRSYNSTICGNTVSACIGKGIRISKAAKGTVVSGNIITGIRQSSSDGDGIVVDSTSVTVSGNQISGCDRHGISVERNASRDVSITGNSCRNNGQTTAGDGININRRGTISNLTVVGNSCLDDQESRTQRSHFSIEPGTRVSQSDCLVTDNNFSSAAGDGVRIRGTGTPFTANNLGQNVVKTLSANSPVQSVAGGALFSLAVRGTINAFTDGTAGQTIKIVAGNSVVVTNNSKIQLQGNRNYSMQRGDTLELTMFVNQVWQETGRSINRS